jgi:hypothetical protein
LLERARTSSFRRADETFRRLEARRRNLVSIIRSYMISTLTVRYSRYREIIESLRKEVQLFEDDLPLW